MHTNYPRSRAIRNLCIGLVLIGIGALFFLIRDPHNYDPNANYVVTRQGDSSGTRKTGAQINSEAGDGTRFVGIFPILVGGVVAFANAKRLIKRDHD